MFLINIYIIYRQIDYSEGGGTYWGVVLALQSSVQGDNSGNVTRSFQWHFSVWLIKTQGIEVKLVICN